MSPTGADLAKLDADAVRATQRLISRGYEAYLVGGCVRDLLLGRTPKDYDIATEARPPQVKRTFSRNCRIIGRRFKLAHLHFDNNTKILEVSTFRRTPQEAPGDPANNDLLITRDNEFGTAEEDALRRDFTVNALFLDPTRDRILDYTNGLADLEARVIRTIGDPRVRFREDPVRILRAVKFAARLGFTIEPETFAAMAETAGDLLRSAPPRVYEEILRLLRSGHALDSFQLLRDVGALKYLLPVLAEFLATARHEQRVQFWALLDALDHRIQSTGRVPQNAVLLGALLACPVQAKAAVNPGRSASSIAEELLSPFCNALRLPRRDAGCLKRICGVQHRFTVTDETKRFRIEGFVHGPYFDEALELFELRMQAQNDADTDLAVQRWYRLAAEFGHHGAVDTPRDEADLEHGGETADAAGDPADDSLMDGSATADDGDTTDDRGDAPPADDFTDVAGDAMAEPDAEAPPRRPKAAAPAAPEPDPRLTDEAAVGDPNGNPFPSDEASDDGGADEGGGRRRRRRRRRRRGHRDEASAESAPLPTGPVAEASEDDLADPTPAAAADGPDADPLEVAPEIADGPLPDEADDDAEAPFVGDFVHPEGSQPAAIEDRSGAASDRDDEPGEPGRRRRRRRRRRRNRDGEPFPPSAEPAPHGEAVDRGTHHHEPLTEAPLQADPDAPASPDDGAGGLADGDGAPLDATEGPALEGPALGGAEAPGDGRSRRRRRRGRRGRGRAGHAAAGHPDQAGEPGAAAQGPAPQQRQPQRGHQEPRRHEQRQSGGAQSGSAQNRHGGHGNHGGQPRHGQGDRRERRQERPHGHGTPRDVDVVPRYRDRRGKVDVIEPEKLDLSAFDVELDPKRVPTFGSIVEGKNRQKRRPPRVPEDGIDDYRPPPPPGSDPSPAPPPPPPVDTPDTFGDW